MSYLGQSIRNRFPLWSKTRKDSSSVAAIMIDSFGEALEEIRFAVYKQVNQNKVLSNKPVSEPGHIKYFSLFENPSFIIFQQENSELISITAEADISGETVLLEEVNSYEELCNGYPTRSELVSSNSNYYYHLESLIGKNKSSNTRYEYYKHPSRLYINVSSIGSFEEPDLNANASENSFVIIRGKDSFGNRYEEKILINNEGLYETKTEFKTIEPLIKDDARFISGGPSIECYGFEGEVEVLKYPFQVDKKGYELKMFNKRNDEINYESSLREAKSFFELDNQTDHTNLKYIFRAYETGKEYISTISDSSRSLFEEEILKQRLVSSSEADIVVSDYTFDEVRDCLLSIDVSGNIHWHKIKHESFKKQQYPRSRSNFLTLESEKQRVSLNETLKMHVSVERPKGTIFKVLVARQKPSLRGLNQEGFLLEYLQDDLSWSETISFYNGDDTTDLFYTFDGITFNNTFEEFGQHDFYVFTFTDNYSSQFSLENVADSSTSKEVFKNTVLKALKEESKSIYVDRYSIMCERNIADKTITTDVIQKITNLSYSIDDFALSIWTDGVENSIYIGASSDTQTLVWKLKEYKDYIVYSHREGTGVLLEEYDSVNLTINGSYTETLNG